MVSRLGGEDLLKFVLASMRGQHRVVIGRCLKAALMVFDLFLVAVTLPVALAIRHDFTLPAYYDQVIITHLYLALAGYGAAFLYFRAYNTVLRLANISTALRMGTCILCGSITFYLLANHGLSVKPIPRSVFLIQILLMVPLSLAVRFSLRIGEGLYHRFKKGVPTLIYGAGRAANSILPALMSPQSSVKVVGLIDDDVGKIGTVILGVKVLGVGRNLDLLIAKYGIKQIIIAIPKFGGKDLCELLNQVDTSALKIKVFADINNQLAQARGKGTPAMRDVSIQDLLRRSPRTISQFKVTSMIRGSVVLVTGGGGSIGSELCRQILSMQPKTLIINDASEFNLYKISEELLSKAGPTTIVSHLGDIADSQRCRHLFAKQRIDTVFHACAFKHVPLVEENPLAAITNNIRSTWNVFEEAKRCKVKHAVLISSDKAVRPTNVMGATKRICELAVLWFAQNGPAATVFSAVRFGNVLGSSGSVVPKFVEQIEAGGPITITHPDVTRYFMLIPEAVSLVLQAATTQATGDLLVLNMGEQIKIYDLATNLIKLKGFVPDKDIGIEFVGLRPGEKLYEELQLESEDLEVISEDIYRVSSKLTIAPSFPLELKDLLGYADLGEEGPAKELLFDLISSYESSEALARRPDQRGDKSRGPGATAAATLRGQVSEMAPLSS